MATCASSSSEHLALWCRNCLQSARARPRRRRRRVLAGICARSARTRNATATARRRRPHEWPPCVMSCRRRDDVERGSRRPGTCTKSDTRPFPWLLHFRRLSCPDRFAGATADPCAGRRPAQREERCCGVRQSAPPPRHCRVVLHRMRWRCQRLCWRRLVIDRARILASSALSTSPDLAMTRIMPRCPSERPSHDPAPSVSGGLGRAKVGDPRATDLQHSRSVYGPTRAMMGVSGYPCRERSHGGDPGSDSRLAVFAFGPVLRGFLLLGAAPRYRWDTNAAEGLPRRVFRP